MKESNSKPDVIIAGAGPAGLTCALYCARAGLRVRVYEKLVPGGQVLFTGGIHNIPGFVETTGVDFAASLAKQAEGAGAEIVYEEFDGDFSAATAVVIATGASPRQTGAEGEAELASICVHYCALCDGEFYKGKNVVVIGGGNSAVGEAIYLAKIAKSVTIVNNADAFNAQKALSDGLGDQRVFHGHVLSKVERGKIEIKNLETGEITKLPADGVFVSIGRKPDSEKFAVEKTKDGYIIVDEKMQTSIPGVFAIGDVTKKEIRQIVTACADGAIASDSVLQHVNKQKQG